jgi:hypothetical protein
LTNTYTCKSKQTTLSCTPGASITSNDDLLIHVGGQSISDIWQMYINQAKLEPKVITRSSGKFSNSRVKGKEGFLGDADFKAISESNPIATHTIKEKPSAYTPHICLSLICIWGLIMKPWQAPLNIAPSKGGKEEHKGRTQVQTKSSKTLSGSKRGQRNRGLLPLLLQGFVLFIIAMGDSGFS